MSPDAALALVARWQFGAFDHDQALRAGFSRSAIKRLVRSGAWIRPYQRVYLDAAVPRTIHQDAMAARLACGPRAVVSRRWAARLLGLDVRVTERPEITVPLDTRPQPPGLLVYRSGRLARTEIATVQGIAVTSAMRTLLDLAGVLNEVLLEIALDALWRRGSLAPDRLLRYLSESWCRKRTGSGALRDMTASRVGTRPPGSDMETVYLQILRRFRVPLPDRQHPVETPSGPCRIDLAYVEQRVAIELDGFQWHAGSRGTFDDDRLRQNEIEALGFSVRRFTWTHLTRDPLLVAVRTAESIGPVPGRWVSRS